MKTGKDKSAVRQKSPDAAGAMPELFIRINLASGDFIGPGKVRLMELIDELGSISAAGRVMGMSYRRAWMLIDSMNSAFKAPVVEKQTGGSGGGGAVLTESGRDIIVRYRRIERLAADQFAPDLKAIAELSGNKKQSTD